MTEPIPPQLTVPRPAPWFHVRCKACWLVLGIALLVVSSFLSLELRWGQLMSFDALRSMGRFVAEFFNPDLSGVFVAKVAWATVETLAMSLLGTMLAACAGLALAWSASRLHPDESAWVIGLTRGVLNVLRAIPELVWAALLLISAGLGPFAGTLALAVHTAGVLGRLFAEAMENAPRGPADALRAHGVKGWRLLAYALLPQVLPQVMSYTLYRWENNIRAAAILGVVGAGGLGQLLSFHLGLFQMDKTATVLLAMLLLVAGVDALSAWSRRVLTR
ncbi:MAG: phosphonate transporter, permease protein PhnE [Pseudomonadota bacterium]